MIHDCTDMVELQVVYIIYPGMNIHNPRKLENHNFGDFHYNIVCKFDSYMNKC